MNSQEKNFVRSFIKILNAAGGVMDGRTYVDMINETKTEMNLERVKAFRLLSIRADMETELWTLTLEGLKFAEVIS